MSSRKRRRQSEASTLAALDLPNIPGVPMDVLPEFVHAIRVTTKFYARYHQKYSGPSKERSNQRDGFNQATTTKDSADRSVILNSLIQRVEAAAEVSTQDPVAEAEAKERLEKMESGVFRWLETVKGFAKSAQRRHKAEEEGRSSGAGKGIDNNATLAGHRAEEVTEKKDKISVPYACFLYLWEMQQNHERVAVRRAALCMAGCLLKRSKDCRQHLEQAENLDCWLRATFFEFKPVKAKHDVLFLQQEGAYWLDFLVSNGYDRSYPKIRVALQRLKQQCPFAMEETTLDQDAENRSVRTFSSMHDWRRIRDIALEHGSEEIARVSKLIERAHRSLEILVPRIGSEEPYKEAPASRESAPSLVKSPVEKEPGIKRATGDGESDEDEDIDWEDGGFAGGNDDGTANIPIPAFEHFSAVERTLAAMESSGRGTGVEIDFRNDPQRKAEDEFDQQGLETDDAGRQAAVTQLKRSIAHLGRRHMPRLTVWLDGLHNADNLMARSNSLVSLSTEMSMRRQALAQELGSLKGKVISLLASAAKLNVDNEIVEEISSPAEKRMDDTTDNCVDTPLSLRLGESNKNQDSRQKLMAAISRRKRSRAHPRSNKIQIKFRSR